jgi:hypothetical protein
MARQTEPGFLADVYRKISMRYASMSDDLLKWRDRRGGVGRRLADPSADDFRHDADGLYLLACTIGATRDRRVREKNARVISGKRKPQCETSGFMGGRGVATRTLRQRLSLHFRSPHQTPPNVTRRLKKMKMRPPRKVPASRKTAGAGQALNSRLPSDMSASQIVKNIGPTRHASERGAARILDLDPAVGQPAASQHGTRSVLLFVGPHMNDDIKFILMLFGAALALGAILIWIAAAGIH